DADHGDVHGGSHLADVLEALGPDRTGATGLDRGGDLRHGARIAHRLTGVGLAGDDQGVLESGDHGMHEEPVSEVGTGGERSGGEPGQAGRSSSARAAAPSSAAWPPAVADRTGTRETTSI